MNAVDMLGYGHNTLLRAGERVPHEHWETEGACGWWSVKDIVIHIASYEYLLAEVLSTFLDGGPTPYMEAMRDLRGKFNDEMVLRNRGMSVAEVLDDYNQAHVRVMELSPRIPAETYRKNGTLPWYGAEYCLDDYIVYTNYAHKREHSGQIDIFADQFDS